MKLKVGDKVRFLDEAIEGTVSCMLSNERVEVSTADGFSLTAFENQLVKVEFEIRLENEMAAKNASEKDIHQTEPFTEKREFNAQEKAYLPKDTLLSSLKMDETIYAAVVLADELSPLTTDVELHVLNNSSYSCVFTLSKKINDDLDLVTADVLPARSEKYIGMFSQDELHQTDGFLFRMIFYKKGTYQPRPPFETTLRIESNRFLDNNYWEKAGASANRILLMPLKQTGAPQHVEIDKLLDKFSPSVESIERKEKSKIKFEKIKSTPKYVILTKEKVIDLHIEELIKDFSNMNNAQIISYQINYFLSEMDQAILNRMHKLTFIHGVGQGVLKSAIREELKKFGNITYGDGPPDKYGYGATEVVFN